MSERASSHVLVSETLTAGAPHVRDGASVDRAQRDVLLALVPCALAGIANAGHQTLVAGANLGFKGPQGWRGEALSFLGIAPSPEGVAACVTTGLLWALPVLATAIVTSLFWTGLFSRVRGREASPSAPVAAVLLALALPAPIPLWQVVLGTSFAIVVGLEIFGGTGRNVVHPAVAGFLFLYFAYPASFSAPGAWVGFADAEESTLLRTLAGHGFEAVETAGFTLRRSALGIEPGALGETSALACALGAGWLVLRGLASWRVLAGGVAGLALTLVALGALSDGRPPLLLPWTWHLATGSFAFGLAFLATDPVTGAMTRGGRWAHGFLVGALAALVRALNPAHPEGTMMAVLLGSMLAPLVDHAVVGLRLARRRRRLG